MKSVYLVLTKWFSLENDKMVPFPTDSNDVKIFSSESRAISYLHRRILYHKEFERDVKFLKSNDYEFVCDFIRGGISFRIEHVLLKIFVNLYDNE